MRRVIFHVGMGKTGSTTIQNALAANRPVLADHGYFYGGQWMDLVSAEFEGFLGFQKFLGQTTEQFVASAEKLVAALLRLGEETGLETFVFSNEQIFENVSKLDAFFKTLAKDFTVEIIVFVRPPATWLPSAYIQWGVVHKTNPGSVQAYPHKARSLVRQYDYLRIWHELHGAAVRVIAYPDGADVVEVFSGAIGVPLRFNVGRQQVRPDTAEILMRFACNNAVPQMALPQVYDSLRAKVPAGTPTAISDKIRHVLDQSETTAIIAENQATWAFIAQTFGLNLVTAPVNPSPRSDMSAVVDTVLGAMLDLLFMQAYQIEAMEQRLRRLEGRG